MFRLRCAVDRIHDLRLDLEGSLPDTRVAFCGAPDGGYDCRVLRLAMAQPISVSAAYQTDWDQMVHGNSAVPVRASLSRLSNGPLGLGGPRTWGALVGTGVLLACVQPSLSARSSVGIFAVLFPRNTGTASGDDGDNPWGRRHQDDLQREKRK